MYLNNNLLVIILLFLSFVKATEPQHTYEIVIDTYNPICSNQLFIGSAVSVVWDRNFSLTNEYDSVSNITTGIGRTGFDFVTADFPHSINPVIGYGLYKIRCDYHNTITYLDYRDCGMADHWDSSVPGSIDIYIKYNWGLHRFEYADTNINEDTLRIWEIFNQEQSLECFQPTTPTNLHYENANGHPRLSWNLSEPQEAATYEVWRKVCSNPPKYSVIVEDWRWVQSLPAGTNNWTDNDFQISGTVNQASYRVRAVSGDGHLYSPSFSNTVTIAGEFLPFDRQPAPAVSLKPNNPSLAIFPNPFNNTLKITIDSPTEPITEMVIFDLRGRAVRRWVSLANPHQVIATWDGSNDQNQPLTSGVYCLLVQTTRHRLFREKILFIK